jgi:hypothetical protein
MRVVCRFLVYIHARGVQISRIHERGLQVSRIHECGLQVSRIHECGLQVPGHAHVRDLRPPENRHEGGGTPACPRPSP